MPAGNTDTPESFLPALRIDPDVREALTPQGVKAVNLLWQKAHAGEEHMACAICLQDIPGKRSEPGTVEFRPHGLNSSASFIHERCGEGGIAGQIGDTAHKTETELTYIEVRPIDQSWALVAWKPNEEHIRNGFDRPWEELLWEAHGATRPTTIVGLLAGEAEVEFPLLRNSYARLTGNVVEILFEDHDIQIGTEMISIAAGVRSEVGASPPFTKEWLTLAAHKGEMGCLILPTTFDMGGTSRDVILGLETACRRNEMLIGRMPFTGA